MSTQQQQFAPKTLKIFVHAIEGIGHLYACVGMAQALASRGHTVAFLVSEAHQGQFSKFGFEELVLKKKSAPQPPTKEGEAPAVKPENPIKEMAKLLTKWNFLGPNSPLEKMREQLDGGLEVFKEAFESMPEFNVQIESLIEQHKPDVFVVDNFVILPAIMKAPCPWVFLCSAQPLCVLPFEGKLPPYGAGFSTDSKPSDWEEYLPVWKRYRYEMFGGKYQESLNEQFNYQPPYELSDGVTLFANSPYLNIYGYPQELDYADRYTAPDNFARVDAFIRQVPEPYELPREVVDMPGQYLVYVSMGSMGSVDVNLMKRVTSILAKNPKYKCIVSKGPLHDEYDLPENCWGQGFLPQTKILPYVDLVITHGGNNTVTESFSFGKPMVVMPLFGDQFDSAQRVHEKGYGIRLEPYTFTEAQLFEAMDQLLHDTELHQRLKAASQRMAQSNSKQVVCQRIEAMVAKYRAEH